MKGACFYLILFTLNILRDLEITGREMSDWISRLKLSSLNQSHMAIHCSRKKISEYQTSSFNQFLTLIFWDYFKEMYKLSSGQQEYIISAFKPTEK